jgi:nicotinic acetylcholine receptor
MADEQGVNTGEDKSPILNNPAFSHSNCPPQVHKSCFCVRFIAEHTRMLEESTKVIKKNK